MYVHIFAKNILISQIRVKNAVIAAQDAAKLNTLTTSSQKSSARTVQPYLHNFNMNFSNTVLKPIQVLPKSPTSNVQFHMFFTHYIMCES